MSTDKKVWNHNEPLFWGLFGAGGVVTSFLAPVLVFVVGLAVPLGLISEKAMAYDRILAFAQNPLGGLILFFVIALTLWHCAHRVFHGLHDLGYHPAAWARIFTYGVALVMTAYVGVTLSLL